MEQLKKDIQASGLLQAFIAGKVGVSPQHLSMMLSGSATMPEDTRLKIKSLIAQASKLSV